MTGLVLALPLLADESKKSGPIGFAVILVLCVVCYFLFKSFSRHLRKVREQFPDGRTTPPAEGSKTPTDADVPPSPPSDESRP
jgi:hypothetical protein